METRRQANDMAKEAEENFYHAFLACFADDVIVALAPTRPDQTAALTFAAIFLCCLSSGFLAFLFNFCAYKLVSIAAQ